MIKSNDLKTRILSTLSISDYQRYFESQLPAGAELGKMNSGGWVVTLCPFHDDKHPSFNINFLQHGAYKCFGCNETGDIFKFHQKQSGCTFPDTLQYFADFLGIDPKKIKPAHKKTKPFEHHEFGWPVEKYPYTDESGQTLYYNCRFEFEDKPKEFRPCTPTGKRWAIKQIKKRVPFQLSKVLKAERVYILNGEKACNAMTGLDEVGTCSVGGEGSWTPELRRPIRITKGHA